jgi:effector-binding domain-containing protein
MKAKNKFIIGFSLLVSGLLIWYLFVKENDYTISFTVKAATGTVFQGINEWSAVRLEKEKETYKTISKNNFDLIKQRMTKGNSQMEYTWEMVPVNDSMTRVNVGIKEMGHELYNKITAPFWNTPFKAGQIKKITSFKDGLNDHISKFKYKIDGIGSSKEEFVAYISLKSVLQTKAQTMIGNDGLITGFLHTHNIKIKGRPYVEVTKWDLDKETLEFNYCFPIDKNTKKIADNDVKFKIIPSMKGLQATYYGNMRTSDRSWFALMDYAKKNGYELINKPLEHFMANPFDGGDELTWQTQVVIPFQKK